MSETHGIKKGSGNVSIFFPMGGFVLAESHALQNSKILMNIAIRTYAFDAA